MKVQLNVTVEEVKDILESYKNGDIDLEQAIDCIYFESMGTLNLDTQSKPEANK